MSRRADKKIPTDGRSNALANSPFDALDGFGNSLPKKASQSPTERAKKSPERTKVPKLKGRVEVRREKAGRGGKTVTTLGNFPTHTSFQALEAMLFDLKKQCACGGTLKGRIIELQGDVRDKVCQLLSANGYAPVRAGG
jgi:translation initiation factor 1